MQSQQDLSQEKQLIQLTTSIKSLLDKKHFKNQDSITYFPYLNTSVEESIKILKKLKKGEKVQKEDTEKCLINLKKAIFCLALQNNSIFIQLFLEKEKDFFSKNPIPPEIIDSKLLEDKDLTYCLIIKNFVETLSLLSKEAEFKYTIDHIQIAIENQAETSVLFLLTKVALTEKEKLDLAQKAKKIGNIAILNALLPQDKYPFYYFSEILDKVRNNKSLEKDEFYYAISHAYRNSNMQNVEILYQNLLNHIEKEHPPSKQLQQLKNEAKKAKEDYPFWASQIVRYRAHCDLYELKGSYGFVNSIQKEIAFGLRNFKIIQDICGKEFKFPPCQPNIEKYYPDCPSPTNFVSMKTLLSYFASQHEAEAIERKNRNATYYNMLSTINFASVGTPCVARYNHMAPFIEKIGLEAKYKPTNELKYIDDSFQEYILFFNKIQISSVVCASPTGSAPRWLHAKCNWSETSRFSIWQEIEKTHKAVFEMDSKAIQKNPTKFYDQVVTLIWLMGQLTPTVRGTGRYVEQWLALAHHFHGLPIPVLKLGFQLDCIDITMNLERYKKLFLHFMEPASLMPSAQKIVSDTANDKQIKDFIPLINRMDSPAALATQHLKISMRKEKLPTQAIPDLHTSEKISEIGKRSENIMPVEEKEREALLALPISPSIISNFKIALRKAHDATTDAKKKAIALFLIQAVDKITNEGDFGKLLLTAERTMSHHTNWLKTRSSSSLPKAYTASIQDFLNIRKKLNIQCLLDSPESINKLEFPALELNEGLNFYTYRFFSKHINRNNEFSQTFDIQFRKIFDR